MALQAHGAAGRARTRPARADATAGVCGAFPAMVANPARTACDWRGTGGRFRPTVERLRNPAARLAETSEPLTGADASGTVERLPLSI